jgi:hypothetical protein
MSCPQNLCVAIRVRVKFLEASQIGLKCHRTSQFKSETSCEISSPSGRANTINGLNLVDSCWCQQTWPWIHLVMGLEQPLVELMALLFLKFTEILF